MPSYGQWLTILVLLLALTSPSLPQRQPLAQANSTATPASFEGSRGTGISQTGPLTCPASGCALGQRLNFMLDFALGSYDPTPTDPPSSNVKVCLYAPTNWVDLPSLKVDEKGADTQVTYQFSGACSEDANPPDGYQLISAPETILPAGAFGDLLGLVFRLSKTNSANGKVVARIFERTASGWARTDQTTSDTINVAAASPQPSSYAYAAALPSECDAGSFTPCYVNSRDDLADGVGTGLKDAIDALPDNSTIFILNNYPIKSNQVQINKPLNLDGMSGSGITYTGTVCDHSMLALTQGGTIHNLSINDGTGCTNPNRTLIELNSPTSVLIELNHLSGGDRAVLIRDNNGDITIRYNQIDGNSGQAIYWDSGENTAPLDVVANNITGNGTASEGRQIECGAGKTAPIDNRAANHNYWGSTSAPSDNDTHCKISAGKQLGAPILARTNLPGVQAERVTVNDTKAYAFDNQIGFQRSGGTEDFDVYLINHGYATETGLPFTRLAGANPNPCSNYWDVFLASQPSSGSTLNLFLKYDKSAACLAAINSAQFCDQTTTASKYPLWWYDPANEVTNLWNTTGQNPNGAHASGATGQTTSCHISDNEIQVAIDTSGRPNLSEDLNFTPFMAGIKSTERLLSRSERGERHDKLEYV